MMWGLEFGWGWWGMLIGGLMMVAFWGLVIFLVVWLVRSASQTTSAAPQTRGGTALDVAQRRYAAGEITREQYEQIRRDLGQ